MEERCFPGWMVWTFEYGIWWVAAIGFWVLVLLVLVMGIINIRAMRRT